MDYKARAYDPLLMRFIQPDAIFPDLAEPQGWNRYPYVRNSPIMYVDPTGHWEDEGCGMGETCELPADDGPTIIEDEDEQDSAHSSNLIVNCFSDPGACYMQGWSYVGSAWSTYTNIDAAFWQRWSAGPYMGVWVDAHVVFAVGAGGLGCAATGEGCVAALHGALGIVGALSIDGNPTNELQAVANTTPRVAESMKSIERWLGGGKLTTIRNQAGNFILRNAENTRRFRSDIINPGVHQGPHVHLDWINEVGEWMTRRICFGQ